MIAPLTSLGDCLAFYAHGPEAYFALALFPAFVGFFVWISFRPRFFGKRFFVIANGAVIWWLFAVIMELWSVAPVCKVIWSALGFPGVAVLPVAWFLFIYRYARGETGTMERWQRTILILVPVMVCALVFTNPLHWQFYGPDSRPHSDAIGAAINYDHRILFFVSALFLYLFIIGSFVLLVQSVMRTTGLYRLHFVLMIMLTLVPITANVAYVIFGWNIAGFDPTPFLFSFVLVVYAALISANQMFQISAIAKELIFKTMPNPVLVIDRDGQIISANKAASALFDLVEHSDVRAQSLPGLPDILLDLSGTPHKQRVSDVTINANEYEVHRTEITRPIGQHDPIMGWVLLFFDVTLRKSEQRTLLSALQETDQQLHDIRAQNRRMSDQALTDPLTGLLNRRSLPDVFDEMVRAVGKTPVPVLLTVIDLDHFKSINDRFGHLTGDLGLVAVADGLRHGFRREDRVFRLGGEEFLILSPQLDAAKLLERLDNLREVILEIGQELGTSGIELRFSAGVAVWPRDGEKLQQLIDIADQRLYKAKAAGRNRTVGPIVTSMVKT